MNLKEEDDKSNCDLTKDSNEPKEEAIENDEKIESKLDEDQSEEKKVDEGTDEKLQPEGEEDSETRKRKIGPASKTGRLPYRTPKRKIGPASKIGRKQVGPKSLNKKPRLELDKLSNLTRKCNFCDEVTSKLVHMVNHTLSHFTDKISIPLPTSQPHTTQHRSHKGPIPKVCFLTF